LPYSPQFGLSRRKNAADHTCEQAMEYGMVLAEAAVSLDFTC
jgi:hypothetical protein